MAPVPGVAVDAIREHVRGYQKVQGEPIPDEHSQDSDPECHIRVPEFVPVCISLCAEGEVGDRLR